MSDLRKYVSIRPTTLSTGVNVGGTTCVPAQIKDRLGNTISDMTSFGTKGFGVISPDTDKEEQFVFTGLSGGTVSGISAVTMQDPYTETSGWLKEHAAGEPIILYTNSPAFYNEFANTQNDNTFVGTQTFTETAMPRITAAHTYGVGEEEFIATKRYVDGVVTGGAADANTTTKGLAEEATQAEIAAGTAAGGTSARLFTNPSTLAAHIQSGSWLFFTEDGTGSDDTYTASLTPALSAYTQGQTFVGKFTVANTGASTLNLNGLGAKVLKKYVAGAKADTETGDIVANQPVFLEYDGTDFVILTPTAALPTAANLQLVTNNIVDLTDGGSTTAHTHNSLLHSLSAFLSVEEDNIAVAGISIPKTGFSDATTKLISVGYSSAKDFIGVYEVSADVGVSVFLQSAPTYNIGASGSSCFLPIGSDVWASNPNATAGNRIVKSGTTVTISGTAPNTFSGSGGALAHDVTNSYLLVLDGSTSIKRYSGIAGTTITYVDAITLDTAVSNRGMLYDNANQRYICLDTTNNLIRRFNSSGTTIDTVAYTVTDTNVWGLCFINNRIYLVVVVPTFVDATYTRRSGVAINFVPTNMTR